MFYLSDLRYQVMNVKVVKVSNVPELVEGMKRHIERIPTMDKDEIRNTLIRIGVLDAEGPPKNKSAQVMRMKKELFDDLYSITP